MKQKLCLLALVSLSASGCILVGEDRERGSSAPASSSSSRDRDEPKVSGLADSEDDDGQAATIRVKNDSSFIIKAIYVSPTNRKRWGPNLLNKVSLIPGGREKIVLDPGRWDIKYVREDGNSYYRKNIRVKDDDYELVFGDDGDDDDDDDDDLDKDDEDDGGDKDDD